MSDKESGVDVNVGTDLTAATAARVRATVADAMQHGRVINLHLESVTSCDLAGLGLLLGLKHRIEAADGHLVCVDPSAPLYAGIRRLGLHRVLDIRLDLPEPGTDMSKLPRQKQVSSPTSPRVRGHRPDAAEVAFHVN